jgi:hypothetical protein
MKKAELGQEVRNRLAQVRYRMALALYQKQEMEPAFAAAEKLAKELSQTTAAPEAAALAGFAALQLYRDAKDNPAKKDAALDRLVRITDFTIKTWPTRPEADDARMSLAQASMVRGESDRAIEMLMAINPKSPKHAVALHLAAHESWRQYHREKGKPEKQRDAKKLDTWLANAEKWLKTSVEEQKLLLSVARDKEEAEEQLDDTKLLLADVFVESKQPAEAVKLYQPLIDAITAAKPKQLDQSQMRMFAVASRCYAAMGEGIKAAESALALANFAGDEPPVNALLVDAVKIQRKELQKAEAEEITAKGDGNLAAATSAAEKVAGCKSMLGALLDKLVTRQQVALPAQVYLGQTALDVGKKEMARDLFQAVLTRAETDAEFREKNAAVLTRVRALRVAILREENKHEEALAEIDKLIETAPKSLDLLMQRGRILQAWAKIDPKHYPEAVSHWTKLRTMLSRSRSLPNEYYEVVYAAAECLVFESEQNKDGSRADQAEQLLRATMLRNPALSGPDMVARYNVLAKKAAALKGEKAGG